MQTTSGIPARTMFLTALLLISSTSLQSLTIANGASFDDSGAISVSMTAGHKFAVAVTTGAASCGTNPTIVVGAVYQ